MSPPSHAAWLLAAVLLSMPARTAMAATEAGAWDELPALGGVGCLVLLLALPLVLLLQALFLDLATRIVRIHDRYWTACKATLVMWAFGILYQILTSLGNVEVSPEAMTVGLVVGALVSTLAIQLIYKCTFWQALAAYVVFLLLVILVSVILLLVLFALGVGIGGWDTGEGILHDLPGALREGFGKVGGLFEGDSEEPAEPTAATLVPVPPDHASRHIGKDVQIILRNGKQLSGTLEAATRETMTIRQHVSGGSISVPIRKGDVREFRVVVYH
ncbi:MAG: hypothetical protein GY842_09135 [bacterium]|nr:hypothetical protein [bacterium]